MNSFLLVNDVAGRDDRSGGKVIETGILAHHAEWLAPIWRLKSNYLVAAYLFIGDAGVLPAFEEAANMDLLRASFGGKIVLIPL